MLTDSFLHIADHDLLVSAARQLRQQCHIEAEALRALETIAARRHQAGDDAGAERVEQLAQRTRAAVPLLAIADEYEALARELRTPARVPA